jgi:hypothetical protein
MDVAVPSVTRPRGWWPIVAALATCLAVAAAPFWPATAGLAAAVVRLVVPVEHTMLLLVPAVAACAAVGWWAGGRLMLALLWAALTVWVLAQRLPAVADGYPELARGWGLLVAASFGVICLVGARRPFLVRALSALGIALVLALGTLAVTKQDPRRLEQVMTSEYSRRVEASLAAWERHTREPAWRQFAERNPELATRADTWAERLRQLPPVAALLVPALVGLESLAALALAWALFHRLSRVSLGEPLSELRAFRFSDQLVWALVVGATLVLLPTLAAWRTVGANVLIFFGALYVLRGLGILTWWAPARAVAFGALGLALLLPLLGFAMLCWTLAVVALGLGLADTWGDWRNRRARPTT